MYPHRDDATQAALDHMPNGAYAQVDAPYLFTARYSLTGFEPRDIEGKAKVDAQGVQDNAWWHEHTRNENRAGKG